MFFRNTNTGKAEGHRVLRVIALVCVLLLAVFMTVEVSHTHSNVTTENSCPLCMAAHWAAPVVAALMMVQVLLTTAATVALELAPAVSPRAYALYNRPPPQRSR